MKLIYFLTLFLSINSFSQEVYPPSFSDNDVYIETAKIQYYNTSKKFGPEIFKSASISITSANRINPSVTIDIPDILYFTEGELYDISYTYKNSGVYSLKYSFIKGKEFLSIGFTYENSSVKPFSILVFYNKDVSNKNEKEKGYRLSEIKD